MALYDSTIAVLHRLARATIALVAVLVANPVLAECGGTTQCIGVGATGGSALTAHHGGTATFTMAFGNQNTATTSASQTAFVAAVTGPATTMAVLGPIAISGINAADFSIAGGTCSTTNGPVHGGTQCTIAIAFTPTSAGAKTATVTVPLNPPACPTCITGRAFTVTGTGAYLRSG